MAGFRRNTPAGTTKAGKAKTSGTAALAKNQMKEGPKMKMVEWRAKSSERWGVARAKMQEKFSRMGADVKLGLFTITHPVHPVRRRAAEDAAKQKKAMAADVRVQQEAAAHSVAAAKRANMRQARVDTLNQGV